MKRITKAFRSNFGILRILTAIALLDGSAVLAASAPTVKQEFPRLGGIQIGKTPFAGGYADPAYHLQLARLDLVLLGGSGHGSNMNDYAAAIKTINPQIVIGKYTNIAETSMNANDASVQYRDKLDSEKGPNTTNAHDWWLRDVNGNKIEIWPGTFRTNLTDYVKPDSNGDRWPEWRAKHDFGIWFNDDVWDYVYSDLASWKPKFRSQGLIGDYSGGKVTKESEIFAAYRRGHVSNWNEIRRLAPNKLIAGNHNWYLFDDADNRLDLKEYKNQLNGGVLERVMGLDRTIEFDKGWSTLYTYYGWTMEYFVDPKIVIFNVEGEVDDYQFFRYAFATCLMNDAFFDYSPASEYIFGTVEWFDEFDLAGQAGTNWLGLSVSGPPTRPWQKGVYRRDFENGIALVNPRGNGTVTITIEDGYRRINGRQDAVVNNGQPANRITLQDADGIILISETPSKPKKRPKAPVLRN